MKNIDKIKYLERALSKAIAALPRTRIVVHGIISDSYTCYPAHGKSFSGGWEVMERFISETSQRVVFDFGTCSEWLLIHLFDDLPEKKAINVACGILEVDPDSFLLFAPAYSWLYDLLEKTPSVLSRRVK